MPSKPLKPADFEQNITKYATYAKLYGKTDSDAEIKAEIEAKIAQISEYYEKTLVEMRKKAEINKWTAEFTPPTEPYPKSEGDCPNSAFRRKKSKELNRLDNNTIEVAHNFLSTIDDVSIDDYNDLDELLDGPDPWSEEYMGSWEDDQDPEGN